MAIIIVAIAIFLLPAIVYLRRRIKLIRIEEKLIYDTIFVKEFFQCVTELYDWNKFFSEKHEISVKRKASLLKTSEMYNEKNGSVYIETKSMQNLEENGRKVYCLEYEFDFGIVVKIYTYVPCVYKKFLATLNNTTFSCIIDPSVRRIQIFDSFDDKIYSASKQTIFQGLAFVLENRMQKFRDFSSVMSDFLGEISETRVIGLSVLKRWLT